MERVEYRVNDNKYQNRLGLSIKYPENVRQKWSEDDVRIRCSECGGTDLRTDLSGGLLVIACVECPNFWTGPVDEVLQWSKDERAIATVRTMKQFEDVSATQE